MKITSGDYEVLYSGSVIGVKDQLIEFDFPSQHASLKIIFEFKSDNSNKESLINFELPNNKTLKIIMTNANSSLGMGNTELLEVGNINKRKLHLNYRIYSIKELSYTMHYTFYLGKEEENV